MRKKYLEKGFFESLISFLQRILQLIKPNGKVLFQNYLCWFTSTAALFTGIFIFIHRFLWKRKIKDRILSGLCLTQPQAFPLCLFVEAALFYVSPFEQKGNTRRVYLRRLLFMWLKRKSYHRCLLGGVMFRQSFSDNEFWSIRNQPQFLNSSTERVMFSEVQNLTPALNLEVWLKIQDAVHFVMSKKLCVRKYLSKSRLICLLRCSSKSPPRQTACRRHTIFAQPPRREAWWSFLLFFFFVFVVCQCFSLFLLEQYSLTFDLLWASFLLWKRTRAIYEQAESTLRGESVPNVLNCSSAAVYSYAACCAYRTFSLSLRRKNRQYLHKEVTRFSILHL